MKKALCLLDEYAKQYNIDYKFIGNIHDEIQTEVEAAGSFFKLNCPLAGDYQVGDNWSQTH